MSILPLPVPRPVKGDPASALACLRDAVAEVLAADPHRVQVGELGDLLVGLQSQLDALQGVAAEWSLAFEDAGGPQEAGSATMAAWVRQHLRATGYEARRRSTAATALRALAATRAALAAGTIGAGHVDAIAHGVRLLGPDLMAASEHIVLEVAKVCDADAVKATIRKLRDTLDPEAADAAYLHALEKRDVTVTPVGDGYAVGGFLDPETGSMLQQVLYAAARPASKDDHRPAGHRRVDALRDLCRSVLDHGLPSDRGHRPHLFVTVTNDRLNHTTGRRPVSEPATLAGYGPISDLLLDKLACDADVTPVLVDTDSPYPTVLDVGRTRRLATRKQRHAVFVAQGGTCFAPGCDRTHLEIHHLQPWSAGGPTDLANLRGYCTRCHHLIHQGQLVVTPVVTPVVPAGDANDDTSTTTTEWVHRTKRGRVLYDRRRNTSRLTHTWTQALLHGGLHHANETRRRPPHRPSQTERPQPP
jgi:hypothetical protein